MQKHSLDIYDRLKQINIIISFDRSIQHHSCVGSIMYKTRNPKLPMQHDIK